MAMNGTNGEVYRDFAVTILLLANLSSHLLDYNLKGVWIFNR